MTFPSCVLKGEALVYKILFHFLFLDIDILGSSLTLGELVTVGVFFFFFFFFFFHQQVSLNQSLMGNE